ncbi:MAG: 3-keto-5-aminohexanoate cleavage protein [Myxococcota bacterium]
MTQPLLITAAICGAELTRADTPWLPLSPEELAAEAIRCYHVGARMVHLHVREPDGRPSQRADLFGQAMALIRAEVPMIVQFSTGGAVGMPVEVRADAVKLRPDMATLTTGTVNFGDDVFANPMPSVRAIAKRLREFGVRPEIECFDTGMVDAALRLAKQGLLELPAHFDFVLGVPGGMGATTAHLDFIRTLIPSDSTWSVAGIGRFELPLAQHAVTVGGHVRVGLEDNIFLSKGVLAEGTAPLVQAVAQMAQHAGRPLATPQQARELLRV